MFLKTYLEVPVGFEAVCRAMVQSPATWLSGLAAEAEEEGERLLVEVGLMVAGHPLRRTAELEVGRAEVGERVASLPVGLRLDGDQRLLPAFSGTLDAAWLGTRWTQLALHVQYEPPLGLVGRAVDRALLHRVAEAAARNFLEGAARRLVISRGHQLSAPPRVSRAVG